MDAVTPVVRAVLAASPSATSSHHKALTPMISGIVSGGLVGLAWIIGFIIYFFKRHRREQRARALGYSGHREMLDPPKKKEAFIIPPDPAIVESGLMPGERIYDDCPPKDTSPKQSQGLGSKESIGSAGSMPPFPHRASAPAPSPSRVVYVKPPSPGRSTKGYDHLPMSPLSPTGRKSQSERNIPRLT